MSVLKGLITNLKVFVREGGELPGIAKCSVPIAKPVTKEFDPGGYAGKVHVPIGQVEVDEFTFELAGWSADALSLITFMPGNDPGLILRTATADSDGVTGAHYIVVQGPIAFDGTEAAKGGENTLSGKMKPSFIEWKIDGKEKMYIDLPNGFARIDGVDQLTDVRKSLGGA